MRKPGDKDEEEKIRGWWKIIALVSLKAIVMSLLVSYLYYSGDEWSETKLIYGAYNMFHVNDTFDCFVHIDEQKDISKIRRTVFGSSRITKDVPYGDMSDGKMKYGRYRNSYISKIGNMDKPMYMHVLIRNKQEKFTDELSGLKKFEASASIRMTKEWMATRLLAGLKKRIKLTQHWHPNVTLFVAVDFTKWNNENIPWDLRNVVKITDNKSYTPLVHLSNKWNLDKHYKTVKNGEPREYFITIHTLSLTSFRAMRILEMLIPEHGVDEIKELILSGDAYKIVTMIMMTILFVLLELIQVFGGIEMWKTVNNEKTMSLQTAMMNVVQASCMVLYILDNHPTFTVKMFGTIILMSEVLKLSSCFDILITNQFYVIIPIIMVTNKPAYLNGPTRALDSVVRRLVTLLILILFPVYYQYDIIKLIRIVYITVMAFTVILTIPQFILNHQTRHVEGQSLWKPGYRFALIFVKNLFATMIGVPLLCHVALLKDDVLQMIEWLQLVYFKMVPRSEKPENDCGYLSMDSSDSSDGGDEESMDETSQSSESSESSDNED